MPTDKSTRDRSKLTFRGKYIRLPVLVLLVSLILAVLCRALLPQELAFSFRSSADERLIARSTFLAWTLAPQFFLVLLGSAIVMGVIKMSARFPQSASGTVSRLLSVMGNMVALPQAILSFAMLDIFLYNAYGIRVIPLWVLVLLVMILGVLILGTFFVRAVQQARQAVR